LFEAKFVIFGFFSTPLACWLSFIFEKGQMKFGFFGLLDFLCRFDGFKDGFWQISGTGKFLDTIFGHRMINFCWKLHENL